MAGHLPFFCLAVLAALVSICRGTVAPEDYWKAMLPHTPMPNSIRERLQSDVVDEKTSTSVDVRKGGVQVDTGKGKPKGGTTVDVGKGGVHVNTGKGKPKGGTTVDVGKGGVHVKTGKGKPNGGTTVGVGRKGVGVNTGEGNTHVDVGKGGVNVNTGHKGKPVIVNVKPGSNPFIYNYAASEDQLRDDSSTALFFLEKDLRPGTKFNILFSKATSDPNFLPRSEANSIPFSSNKISEILGKFSIERDSQEAQSMVETIKQCEEPATKGEAKKCVTSLESMIDFATSKLGKNVRALGTEVHKEAVKQQYTISAGVQKMASAKSVACHSETYVYAVYYCHETPETSTYLVPLVGQDKTRADAVAVCHKDTSQWNPKHVAFQVLKVKPGSVPICHFIPEDHIVWVQN